MLATPTHGLMKRPTKQHGGTHMERRHRKHDSQTGFFQGCKKPSFFKTKSCFFCFFCVFLFLVYNLKKEKNTMHIVLYIAEHL